MYNKSFLGYYHQSFMRLDQIFYVNFSSKFRVLHIIKYYATQKIKMFSQSETICVPNQKPNVFPIRNEICVHFCLFLQTFKKNNNKLF